MDREQALELLRTVHDELRRWAKDKDGQLQSSISRKLPAVREVVKQLRLNKVVKVVPPAMIGGPVVNLDPLVNPFGGSFSEPFYPIALRNIDEAIGAIEYGVIPEAGDVAVEARVRPQSKQPDTDPYARLNELPSGVEVQRGLRRTPCAVILTALPLEYKAVKDLLTDVHEYTHRRGTIYERGRFERSGTVWDIVIAEIGQGNPRAAVEAERAIENFEPEVALFVGVAGGVKDVSLGDVVAATHVYGYESGKAKTGLFHPRPDVGRSSYRMEQRAKAEAKKDDWKSLSSDAALANVYVAPIAAGEKVVASEKAAVAKFLREMYGNTLAVEMEGRGFLEATHANHLDAIVVRGISDLLSGKRKSDAARWQAKAARNAAAFALHSLSRFVPPTFPSLVVPDDNSVRVTDDARQTESTVQDAITGVKREIEYERADSPPDALEPLVSESISLLKQRHERDGALSRSTYRDLLNMLTVLADDEFCAMRSAIHVLKTIPRVKGGAGEPGGDWVVTSLIFNAAPQINDWNWYAIQTRSTFQLARGDVAVRVVDALERLGRTHFVVTSRSNLDASRKGHVMNATIDLLAEVMPPPREKI